MSKLPRARGKDAVKALTKAGYEVSRIRGSHHFLQDSQGRGTVVPVHAGETIGPGLLRKMLRDCDIAPEELIELL